MLLDFLYRQVHPAVYPLDVWFIRLIIVVGYGVSPVQAAVDPPFEFNLNQPLATPMDWSKSVVSRGFGTSEPVNELPPNLQQAYKSGQVSYFFKQYPLAFERWLPVAESGFAEAQANIAWLYQAGLGVEKDLQKALQWYRLAIAQNHAVAKNNMAVMYENALGVKQDYNKAFNLYSQSAEAGYRFAQHNLAILYLEGKGVKKNSSQAKYWLQLAAKNGVAEAVKKLQDFTDNSPTLSD